MDNNWFADFKKGVDYQTFSQKPIAYFCAEYALFSDVPTYAGGLGILSGDYIREAADRNLPLLAVGLYYREAQNSLVPAKEVNVHGPSVHPELSRVVAPDGKPVIISVPIQARAVYAEAWVWKKGTVSLFFLNSNIQENHSDDRLITEHLYVEDRAMRLKQEMLLGIGGFRLLEELGHHCSVYHLNEGHSAFLALELVRHEMKHQKVDFLTACTYASKHIVFTNHTLVAAGQEQFSTELLSAILLGYAEDMQVPVADIIKLGTIDGSTLFSMTTLSFRLSTRRNAVSKLHAEKALEIWPTYPMMSITNGIYLPRWDAIDGEKPEKFIGEKRVDKQKLIAFVKEVAGEEWPDNSLVITWARRLVPYKRPLIFFEDMKRLQAIIKKSSVPVKIIFSGPTENSNEDANELVVKIKEVVRGPLKGSAVFISNYSMNVAEILVAGSDIWLNTPVVGSEACGTSGMKGLLNGALPLTTRDGWVHEIETFGIGWSVDEPDVNRKLLDNLEGGIIPEYAAFLKNPETSTWLVKMIAGRKLIRDQFGMSRVLRQYITDAYIPALHEKHEHLYE